jgi:hypothetical protein
MARVRLIRSGVDALLHDKGVTADLTRRAERVLTQARAAAPVDTGAFRDSLGVVQAVTDRTVARVVTTDPLGLVKEARFRTLTRALDAAR